MTITFNINEDKSVGFSLRFDDFDKMNGRQGLTLVAQCIINSLGDS